MKRFLIITILLAFFAPISYANDSSFFKLGIFNNESHAIKSMLNSQVRYANRSNFKKFISTYDDKYINSDGLTLAMYADLVKDVWNTYDDIEYGIKIENIEIKDDTATVNLEEFSHANIPAPNKMNGILKSNAKSIYYLKKIDGKWKVSSDSVISENTSMLYGDAKGLDIRLTAPQEIPANTEYTASLEFIPPEDSIVIASIANDKVEYPQKQAKEVFRKFPDDNILERLFTSNSDNVNEYVIASIGITKADIKDSNIKLSLTGFGYQITRVNVISKEDNSDKE